VEASRFVRLDAQGRKPRETADRTESMPGEFGSVLIQHLSAFQAAGERTHWGTMGVWREERGYHRSQTISLIMDELGALIIVREDSLMIIAQLRHPLAAPLT
jgi:hypothetical protein